MSDTDTTDGQEDLPLEASWNWADDFCTEPVEDVLADICHRVPPQVAARVSDLLDDVEDPHTAHDILGDYVLETGQQLTAGTLDLAGLTQEEYRAALTEVEHQGWRLTYCTMCDHAEQAWADGGEKSIVDVLITAHANNETGIWSLTSHDKHQGERVHPDTEDVTELEDLIKVSNTARGSWDRVTVTWDGEVLTLVVGTHDGSSTVRATPLPDRLFWLYQNWQELEPDHDDLAHRVLNADENLLELALEVADALVGDDVSRTCPHEISTIVDALAKLTPDQRETLDYDLLLTLAQNWTLPLEDLFTTAAAVHTPSAPAA
jgi:hypothetical protein